MTVLFNTYARQPVAFDRGEGVWLWDTAGRRYLDGVAGIAVCGLGHAHPAITEALQDQASRLVHTSNLYQIPLQEQAGELLTARAGMERVFFCNSGAEANEALIKLARLHGHQRGIKSPVIVVMDNSFHGRTLATLSATGNRKVQAGFEPLVSGFLRVPFGDLSALESLARGDNDIVAVLVEPIQGEGGVNVSGEGYLQGLRQLCDDAEWLLLLDEVQTGIGRTGHWFGHQYEDIQPDAMSLAKALGNGFPVGACVAQGTAASLMGPGSHGTTFGGSPLASRVVSAVLETVHELHLVERAGVLGRRLRERLSSGLAGLPGVVEIRGRGLMMGIELDRPCGELVARGLEQGLLINVTAQRVIRLLPPLVMSDAEADQLADGVIHLVRGFLS
ncbi:MAG: aspartate aminotransferase family protein [Gammaproteobacteria bacterium]|nr:aspartate aminotransferase family protein [Gammaproteobacteria bacterium]